MKIDIDLSEIIDGEENLDSTIKDIIVDAVIQKVYSKADKEIAQKISGILEAGITVKLKEQLDKIIPELMDYEFVETSTYGATGQKTTVKNRILKQLATECTWSKNNYSSDQNAFTKTVTSIVESQMSVFKKEINNKVDEMFTKEALSYAQKKLSERLGIKS